MGFGVPSRAPTRDSARPIVHTATAGKPSSFICKQSSSRVQVGRCHPKSSGVRPSKRTSTRSNRSSALRVAVAAPPVVQPVDAIGEEPIGGTDHGRRGDVQLGGHLRSAAARAQPRNGLKPQRGVRVAAAASEPDQLPSLDATHSRYLHRTGLLGAWVSGDSQTSGLPRPFPSALRLIDNHAR